MSQASRTIERTGPKLTGRAAALLVVVTMLAILTLVPAQQFLHQRGQIAELERQAAQLASRNAELRDEISKLNDPTELERLARECLGMVMAGETALIIPGRDRPDC